MTLTTNKAVLPQTPLSKTAVLTTAETAFNNPTAIVTLLDDATNTNGARLTKLYAIPRAAIGTANNIQIYKKVGTTYTLIDSALMATVTPAGNVASPKTDFGLSLTNPMEIEANVGIVVAMGQSVANGVVVRCEGAYYG